MLALRAVLVLLGCLLALVGCGGGDSPPLAVGLSTSNAGARFQWRTASAPDPVTTVSVKDAEGTVVTAGAGQLSCSSRCVTMRPMKRSMCYALICIASGNEGKKHDDQVLPDGRAAAGFSTHVLMVSSNGPGDPRGPAPGFPSVQADANEGLLVPITAPGEGVSPGPSATPDGGTSYAAPLVSGAALAVMQTAPHLTAAQVRALLIESASRNVVSGSGIPLLDVDAALSLARSTSSR